MKYFISIGLLCLLLLIVIKISEYKLSEPDITYWAVSKNGDRSKVETFIAVPLLRPEDVNNIWPVYVAEKQIWLKKHSLLILQSQPFILSGNPKIQGEHYGRMVYFVKGE